MPTRSLEGPTVPPPKAKGEEVDFIRGPPPRFRIMPPATCLYVGVMSGLVGVCYILSVYLARGFGVERGWPPLWPHSYFCLLVCALLLLCHWRDWREVRALPRRTKVTLSRLSCISSPRRFHAFGPLTDASFEPQMFRAPFAFRLSWPGVFWTLVLAASMCLLAIAINEMGQFIEEKMIWVSMVAWIPWTALCLSLMVVTHLLPTYIRLIPGRIDIVRFDVLRDRLLESRSIELRSARIIACVQTFRTLVLITLDDNRMELDLRLMRERDRFVYYLFLAALSTHQAPPQADEVLVG